MMAIVEVGVVACSPGVPMSCCSVGWPRGEGITRHPCIQESGRERPRGLGAATQAK